jgi:hypothetical protein
MTTLKMKMVLSLLALAAMVGCGSSPRTDSGVTADAGAVATDDTGPRRDAAARPDAFSASTDACASEADTATTTVGCNGGFASSMPAANAPGGTCTGGGEAMPAGTCTGMNALCGAEADMPGFCLASCEPGSTYITTGSCPTGFRCFDLMGQGVCFQDCDATHACPAGQMCDAEGSCVGTAG